MSWQKVAIILGAFALAGYVVHVAVYFLLEWEPPARDKRVAQHAAAESIDE